MIELLVVIAIIGLLSGLLVMAISHMSKSGKANATKADLQNVKGMFDELNAATGLTTVPQQWLWRSLSNSPAVVNIDPAFVGPPAYSTWGLDFWHVPMRQGTMLLAPPVLDYFDCLDAPAGLLTTDNPVARNASRAVLNTQLAMRVMLSLPANRTAIGQLPADRLMVPEWQAGGLASGMQTGRDGIYGTNDDSSDSVKTVVYAINNCVRYQGASYRCIKANVASAGSPPPSDSSEWIQDGGPTPVILDAWGNPIIFVPATGLIDVFSGAGSTDSSVAALPLSNMPPNVSRKLPPITSPEGQNDPNYTTLPLPKQPVGARANGRPFFVSAGPDGNLSTGDDNIYSFDK
jgi:hypothetical protein